MRETLLGALRVLGLFAGVGVVTLALVAIDAWWDER